MSIHPLPTRLHPLYCLILPASIQLLIFQTQTMHLIGATPFTVHQITSIGCIFKTLMASAMIMKKSTSMSNQCFNIKLELSVGLILVWTSSNQLQKQKSNHTHSHTSKLPAQRSHQVRFQTKEHHYTNLGAL